MGTSQQDEFIAAMLPALDLVYNLARGIVSDPDVVEDVVQETYVRAFEAWTAGRKPRKVEPWLATICLNVGRSYWRRASTRREVLTTEGVADTEPRDDVERDALRSIERQAIHDALWRLPEAQRLTITLMDLDGFTAAEVGRIMKAPRGTVLARAHRGRKKLAGLIDRKVINLET